MAFDLCDKRKAIIAQEGHLLVTGGPGSGKTTVALLKAKERIRSLKPGQEVLFLSFSRAAVRQILIRCRDILSAQDRKLIQVQTYHAFCLEVLQAHGRLLLGKRPRVILPDEERLQKSACAGDWEAERERLSMQEGVHCFDFLAPAVAAIFERCKAVRKLYGEAHPMIIVDEFQDTDNDQWRMVRALSETAEVFFLADPDQCIFDYRPSVDPRRLEILQGTLHPVEFDLTGENHRSPNAGILRFANSVLRNQGPLPETGDVQQDVYHSMKNFAPAVHLAVIRMFREIRKKGVEQPCIAVLARSNDLVAQLSAVLAEEHIYAERRLPPISHDVVWDAELAAAAAQVVASMMEWSSMIAGDGVARTLRLIAHYHRLKNASNPSMTAATAVDKFIAAAQKAQTGTSFKFKPANLLEEAFKAGLPMDGLPVKDWVKARELLNAHADLQELQREARMVKLFRASDALASGLGSLWLEKGSYRGAADLVKRTLDRERLMAAERDPEGCILMSMHKSKGKEFDGVVVVEGAMASKFFNERPGAYPFDNDRRVLRVAITRARHLVSIVRPHDAHPLIGPRTTPRRTFPPKKKSGIG